MNLFVKTLIFTAMVTLISSCEISPFGSSSFGITWTPPVERENGDKLLAYEIGGYEISYRKIGSTDYKSITIEDPSITEYFLPIQAPGEYEVRIAAFDTNGLYSRFSDPATFSTP